MNAGSEGIGTSRIASTAEEAERRIRLLKALLMVLVVLGIGTAGYYGLTGGVHTLSKCFYMTVITVSTVGYGEVIPVTDSEALQLFTAVLILLGGGAIVYFLSSFTAIVIEGDLAQSLWRRRMEKKLSEISDHVVVAGMTMTGMNVVRDLVSNGVSVVAIDPDPERINRILVDVGEKVLVLPGDPLQESVLASVSLPSARGNPKIPVQRHRLAWYLALASEELGHQPVRSDSWPLAPGRRMLWPFTKKTSGTWLLWLPGEDSCSAVA